jgi:carboxyl-terminal processing protease
MRRLALVLLAPALLLTGLWLGGHPSLLPEPVRDAFVDDDTAVITAALDRIDGDFVREVPRARLVDGAIRGAVASLDDQFSAYFSPQEYSAFQDASHSRFSGVGLAVQEDPLGLRVTRVYDGSPARTAGLRTGDVITEADGRDLAGVPQEAAVERVKGPAGTQVRLTVRRGRRVLTKDVTRATVSVPVVETRVRETAAGPVGVLALASFSSGAHAELYAGVRRLRARGVQGLVLDLRGNPGGLVSEAQLVASAFLREGEVVSMRGRAVEPRTLNATGDPVAPDLPLVVLTDEGTASAAEIVTGALKDRDRARVVGQRTFGKGVFQEVMPLDNGGALDLTVGRYFTPDGTNLGKGTERGTGVAPDVRARDDPETRADEALARALAVLGTTLR